MSRRSPGMVNGYPPRNEVTVLQMEPKRPQQQRHPSVGMKQPKFIGNGMAPQMVANSPALHSRQQQMQQHKWGKQPQLQQQPQGKTIQSPSTTTATTASTDGGWKVTR